MKFIKSAMLTTASVMAMSTAAFANEYAEAIQTHLDLTARTWAQNAMVVDAIKAQNEEHKSLTEEQIIELDQKWRAETKAADQPMITKILNNALSDYLRTVAAENPDVYSEIFVMDNKGLNVGQIVPTSDYWQGDEAKFKKSYGVGADGLLIDDVEFDESSQTFQSQASFTIVDPDTNEPIGAVTIGINVDAI